MQEISADRLTAQPRAVVLYIGSAANGNLLKSVRYLFNWPLSREVQLQPGLPIAGTLSIATPIAYNSP